MKQEYENKLIILQTTFDSLNKIEKPVEFKKTVIFNEEELNDIIKKINEYNNLLIEIKIAKEHNDFIKKQC